MSGTPIDCKPRASGDDPGQTVVWHDYLTVNPARAGMILAGTSGTSWNAA